jgi:RNA polymerase sigma-70 factor (ECF subfamily)
MPAIGPVNTSAFQTLWTQHERELRRWLLARAPDAAEVDDILQDVLMKCLRQGPALAAIQQPRAWLFEVTRNTLTDRLRRMHPTTPLPDDVHELPAPQAVPEPLDDLAQACLPRVLGELEAQDREAIELCDLQGMPQADFARLKGLSLPAAKSRVQRARRRMRERMVQACQVSLDDSGRVADFVPRPPPLATNGDGPN